MPTGSDFTELDFIFAGQGLGFHWLTFHGGELVACSTTLEAVWCGGRRREWFAGALTCWNPDSST